MDQSVKKRLKWVELYEETKNAGLVCLKCGISRPTLRLWVRRYKEHGLVGLQDQSMRPASSPNRKVHEQQEQWILELRRRRLGARRIKSELLRLHGCALSLAPIPKVLSRHQQPPLKRSRLTRKKRHRYERPVPGEQVQMDVCKIAPGIYQYTAIDDCTRFKVLAIYPRRTAANSLRFLEHIIEEFPFHFQRVQTDRGKEFFATAFQERLMEYGIKFRPIKPGSPHLNRKVERTQKTDLEEFWATADTKDVELPKRLREWQDYYNHERPHGSLGNRTPWEKWYELASNTPLGEEVEAMYDASTERIQEQNYRVELQLRKLKEGV